MTIAVLEVVTTRDSGGAQETVVQTALTVDPALVRVRIAVGPDMPGAWDRFTAADAAELDVDDIPSLRRAVRPFADVRAIAQLIHCIRTRHPDVVHTHSSKAGVIGRLAARLAGVPVVHTVHGWSFSSLRGGRRKAVVLVERALAKITNRLVVVSEDDLRVGLEARIGRRQQYVVVRSGIDLADVRAAASTRAATRDALGLAPSDLVVGSVARLSRQKDPATLVEAFARAAETRPRARLVLVGSGPLHDSISRQLDDLGATDRVLLLGERRDVPTLLHAFDAFAMASRWEGLPRGLVEAMAAGLPVVATAVNGVPEVITHDHTGLLVGPGDVNALAGALGDVLDDAALRTRLGAAASGAVDGFDVDVMARQLEAVYAELAGSATGSRASARGVLEAV